MAFYCCECEKPIVAKFDGNKTIVSGLIDADNNFYHIGCYDIHKNRGNGANMCPKCAGSGIELEPYNAYPKGLPDSDWEEDIQYRKHQCTMCGGKGFSNKKVVQVVTYKFED